ncbi:MAG: radical SAM protein [Chloroflexi bacterium]|nr:radical SAM protein [Chloroflexota bacterium]
MVKKRRKILLLDLYEVGTNKPFIQPYLYLGAFFDHLHINYELYRWQEDEGALIEQIDKQEIGFVFINLIMGPVLGLVEPVCRLIKKQRPSVKIWVGGIAVHFIRELLAACPFIDRVSDSHPRHNPQPFAEELVQNGILTQPAQGDICFPLLVTNRAITSFIHQHQRRHYPPVKTINLSSSSGCHHRCSFCYLARTKGWVQPLDRLFADLEMLQEQYDVRYFEFSDDNFPQNRQRLKAFRSRVLKSGLEISYFCLGSIDALNAETLELMVESGLKRLFIGIDAIRPEYMQTLNKNYEPKRVFKTMELVRAYPIDLTLSLVIGNPGETREQIQELYDWAESIAPEICYAQFLTPYPKTPTFVRALRRGFQPPQSLSGWARVADFERPKAVLNPAISEREYVEWGLRFRKLSTRRFRSDIGESVRRAALGD